MSARKDGQNASVFVCEYRFVVDVVVHTRASLFTPSIMWIASLWQAAATCDFGHQETLIHFFAEAGEKREVMGKFPGLVRATPAVSVATKLALRGRGQGAEMASGDWGSDDELYRLEYKWESSGSICS